MKINTHLLKAITKNSLREKELYREIRRKMKTIIREHKFTNGNYRDHGWGNGYVVIPKGKPIPGFHLEQYDRVDVHNGITFSKLVDDSDYWNDWEDIYEGDFIVGFDTRLDILSEWTKERVQEEANRLMEQIKKLQINDYIHFNDKDFK